MKRKKLLEIVWFLVKFNLLALPMYILMYFNFSLLGLQSILAQNLYRILNFFGYDVIVNGFLLGLMSASTIHTVEISVDCTGWKSMYTLAALTFATPKRNNREKMGFLALGIPIIFSLNFLRLLTTLIAAYKLGFEYLKVIDTLLWSEGLILAVVAMWYLWLKTEKHNISRK